MKKIRSGLYICRGHVECISNRGSCPHAKPHKWNLDGNDSFLGCYTGRHKGSCDCIRTTKIKAMLEKL